MKKNIKIFNLRMLVILGSSLFCWQIFCSGQVKNCAGDYAKNNNIYLFRAAKKGDIDWVKKLVEKNGADVNYATSSGKTVLIKASSKKQKKVVKYLLELRDGVQDKNNAQDKAKDKNNAQDKSNKKIVNIDAADNNGDTALHKAAKNGDADIVQLLISVGANTNKQNRFGDTPIHLSVKNEDLGAFRQLVECGANFEIKNNKGNTVLHAAAKGNYKTAVEILIKRGANINTKNKIGKMPIDDAKYGTKALLVKSASYSKL